ncbi:MAG: TAXI family TRAP transporter solute-binding subunit, partial [Parvularculaceae bacterium]|nr:TAXI family TRAP transporter solute-binding subunit [Parvularculaceae bacterium]
MRYGRWCRVGAGILALVICHSSALAQAPAAGEVTRRSRTLQAIAPVSSTQKYREALNQNTITIVSGNPNGTYLALAYDMSAVLDNGNDLRVLAVIGKGGAQNVRDILHLRGVDMGITQATVMARFKQTGELGAGIDQRLAYITQLYNEEMHILAGPGIERIKDLDGKKVNFSDVGSGTQFTTRLVFESLGIKPIEVNMGQADAYQQVKSGGLAATVLIAGKPAGSFSKFKLEGGMRLLPVAYEQALQKDYLPAKLTHKDYPGLIAEGKEIETIAVSSVLAVYNWPKNTDRYRRVAQFVDQFFTKLPEFHKGPRHPKWLETSLTATLPGWTRFPAAQEWIDNAKAKLPPPTRDASKSVLAIDVDLARMQAAA